MNEMKSKAKKFWEEHKVGLTVTGAAAGILGVGALANNCYKRGMLYGVAIGSNATMDWLDATFPGESKVRELYKAYAQEHPEGIWRVNPFGKVIKN